MMHVPPLIRDECPPWWRIFRRRAYKKAQAQAERARLVAMVVDKIEQGISPIATPVNTVLRRDEFVCWAEAAVLWEERVISRRYEGGSRGISIRIVRGVSYRIGSHRGRAVSERGMVPTSRGQLIISNRRIIF